MPDRTGRRCSVGPRIPEIIYKMRAAEEANHSLRIHLSVARLARGSACWRTIVPRHFSRHRSGRAYPHGPTRRRGRQQFQGDDLSATVMPDGARLRCAFHRWEGEGTRDGLWLRSTAGDAQAERLRVIAVAAGRELGGRRSCVISSHSIGHTLLPVSWRGRTMCCPVDSARVDGGILRERERGAPLGSQHATAGAEVHAAKFREWIKTQLPLAEAVRSCYEVGSFGQGLHRDLSDQPNYCGSILPRAGRFLREMIQSRGSKLASPN